MSQCSFCWVLFCFVCFLSAAFDQTWNLKEQSNGNHVYNGTLYSKCFSSGDWGEGAKLQFVHHRALVSLTTSVVSLSRAGRRSPHDKDIGTHPQHARAQEGLRFLP